MMRFVVMPLLVVFSVLVSCQSPVSQGASGASAKGLTVSWSQGAAKSRTILPSGYPTPGSYEIILQPTGGSSTTQTGITGSSYTFTTLPPSVYTVTVKGFDASGNLCVTGSGSVDTTTSSSSSVAISLGYITNGTGTGGIDLTLNLVSAGVTPVSISAKLVDPLGNTSQPALTVSGANYAYVNTSAQVGTWLAVFTVKTSTQTAIKVDTVIVVQDTTSTGTETLSNSDFGNTYVAVTGLSLSKTSATGGAGLTDTLTATLAPAGASNQAVAWSSSNTSYATVDSTGAVSFLAAGVGHTVTIKAAAVDNPSFTANCVYTVAPTYSVFYNANTSTGGSVPIDSPAHLQGATVTVQGTTGLLTKTGFYTFVGWNTAADGSGTQYAAGASLTVGSANITLYAIWAFSTASWAQTTTAGSGTSLFKAVAMDPSGNLYAVGYIAGTGAFNFGNGVTAQGTSTGYYNGVIVKYNASGVAQWAQTVTSGTDSYGVSYYSVAVDSNGNVYAAGYCSDSVSFGFGNGVFAAGTAEFSGLVVKYSSAGVAQWAKTMTSGTSDTTYYGVTADASGNVYAAGMISGNTTDGFGNSVTATGPSTSYTTLLVKYDSSGTTQWARTMSSGTGTGQFNAVAVDSSGNVYAAGGITQALTYGFGNGITATGANGTSTGAEWNGLVVEFNSAGAAQQAITLTTANGASYFNAVVLDSGGNIYVAGSCQGAENFGNGVTISTSVYSETPVVVKYSSSGAAQWASPATSTSSVISGYSGLALDTSGNLYAAGSLWAGVFTFGNNVTLSTGGTGNSPVVAKYSAAGVAQWAQSLTSGSSSNLGFNGIAVDSSGNTFVVGNIGSGQFGFGNGVSVTAAGTAGSIVAVKYGAY